MSSATAVENVADQLFHFAIDRGGTFTDVYARCPGGKVRLIKLLSEDPAAYSDAPREAIRRVIHDETGRRIGPSDPIDPTLIGWIRMGTTVATNALLERKGERIALVVTEGFRDVLTIGNQSRPDIFDLSCRSPDVLYTDIVEAKERVVLTQKQCQIKKPHGVRLVTSATGDQVEVWQELDQDRLRKDLQNIRDLGIKSLAVALLHSYAFPEHEQKIAQIAHELGFEQVTLSSSVMPMIKLVPRGLTACADAYLTPHITRYIAGFADGFQGGLDKLNVLFMQSDGGLTPVDNFNGSRAILSGPAGGVVGYARTTMAELGESQPLIGFDMGGTSTDVSRFDGSFEHTFEAVTAGVTIQSPQLDISTVAAGGGSRLFYRSGLFVVGPESAGANPGPACYRNGGPLTVTDANLVLGRVLPNYFPHIFGPNKNQPLDVDATNQAFLKLTNEINQQSSDQLSVQEVAMGFIRVANEAMCRPIRAITEGKGFDSSQHVLVCFGGAGGQHACSVARSLGIRRVFIHRYSGILSAFGMALADIVHEQQEPTSTELRSESTHELAARIDHLRQQCRQELLRQGHRAEVISFEIYLNLRYEKTDFAIMTRSPHGDIGGGDNPQITVDTDQYRKAFTERYRREFGFNLGDRKILVDDVRVRGVAHSHIDITTEQIGSNSEHDNTTPIDQTKVYFENDGFLATPIFKLDQFRPGHKLPGPALITESNSTILVEPRCLAQITKLGNVIIELESEAKADSGNNQDQPVTLDRIQLSVFSHRFMSIAEQMGRVLQRTSISTNIKERLDFSCALFGPDGGLVSNAPHIPVHLGAMQKAVQFQLDHLGDDIQPGDVLLSNHPSAGGSHLPDLTVITPVFFEGHSRPVFFVASRGHHADIGGITPGSMPPHSTSLDQEGATFVSFKLVKAGHFQEVLVSEALMAPGKLPGSSGCRNLSDCISDLQAQVAANNKGIKLVTQLINQYGLRTVQAYMAFIQQNADRAVRDMLRQIANQLGRNHLEAEDLMDDGSPIKLTIDIDPSAGSATFDFTGTGTEVHGNCNAPEAVTMSAVIYCLRCLVGYDVPLNQGCLGPIQVRIPMGSIISPSPKAAVVGGNVLTSQRVVDVILKAFEACGASQGCMNNITFGDDHIGYYETVAGGAGAGLNWHGRSGVHTHMTNTRITDPEIIEKRYPVLVKRFHMRPGTGGHGRFRGGDGLVRELQFRKQLVLSVLTERRVFAPYGLNGGEQGQKGRNTMVYNDGRVVNLGAKCSVTVGPGDLFRLETPGGGGFGHLKE